MSGNATPWELRTWQSERACPVCAIPLFAASKDDYRIDACGKCGGSWMSIAHMRKMIDTSHKTPIELARMADAAAASAPAPSAGPRACPECKKVLVTENLGGVDIDVCDEHGTWFDRSELERVALVLLDNYGVARRIKDAEAARKALPEREWYSVDPKAVAYGVAAVGFALVGAAVGVRIETDIDGREWEIDLAGNRKLRP